MFDSVSSVLKRALLLGFASSAVIALIGSALGYLLAGQAGLAAGLIGAGLAFGFSGLTALSMLIGHRLPLGAFFAVVMGGWLVKIVAFMILVAALQRATWLTGPARPVFFFAVVAAILSNLVVDGLVAFRSRVPSIDEPKSAK